MTHEPRASFPLLSDEELEIRLREYWLTGSFYEQMLIEAAEDRGIMPDDLPPRPGDDDDSQRAVSGTRT